MRKSLLITILLCGLALVIAPAAQAHFIWLNPPAEGLQPGQPLEVTIGWGHCFPASEECNAAKIGPVRALGPEGRPAKLAAKGALAYELTPSQKGCHLALAAYAPGFLTKTPQGYKHQDKTGLAEARGCFHYDLRGKALLAVPGAKGWGQRAGDILELVPQANPADLKPGDELPALVLFQGQPLAGVQVQTTHAGFSDKPNQFAWQGSSDAQGLVRVPLKASGPQLIAVTYKKPYPQPEKCDELMYKYTLTFRLP